MANKLFNMKKTLTIDKTKWICWQTPEQDDIEKLSKQYNFHEMIKENMLDINAESKFSTIDDNFFMALAFTKYLKSKSKYVFNELDIVIWKDYIITTTWLFSEKLDMVFNQMSHESKDIKNSYKSSPYFILYKIIDVFYDKTLNSLDKSAKKLLNMELNIWKNERDFVSELISEDLNKIFVKHNFISQEDVIDELIEHLNVIHEKRLIIYFNNLRQKLTKIIRTIESLEEKNDSLISAYNTYLSIKSNKSITRLTFINSTFLPLTILVGMLGMSERTMMTGPENWTIAYSLFIVLCVVIGLITNLILKKIFS
jgi:magnesium transporter